MTHKARMVRFLRGEEVGRMPLVQYSGLAAPDADVWAAFGEESMAVLAWAGATRSSAPNCEMTSRDVTVDGGPGTETVLTTPAGSLVERRKRLPDLPGVSGFVEHFVKTVDDYEILLAYLNDLRVEPAPEGLAELVDRLGEHGLPHVALPRTPYQALWVQWAALDHLGLHLYDRPDLLEAVMVRLGELLVEAAKAAALAAKDAEFYHVVIGDNISAPLIGPDRFERWCRPYYEQVTDIAHDAGLKVFAHLDGDLAALGDAIARTRFDGVDSMSPPPDNDMSVAEALRLWPDKMVWANFPSSVHLQPPEAITETARRLLEEGGRSGRFWIQLSENLPPGRWRTSIPAINRAIDEFYGAWTSPVSC